MIVCSAIKRTGGYSMMQSTLDPSELASGATRRSLPESLWVYKDFRTIGCQSSGLLIDVNGEPAPQ